jgi:putative membrane protein
MSVLNEKQLSRLNLVITLISIALPLVVVILFGVKLKIELPFDPHLLPFANAILNSISALTLIAALIAVKQKNIKLHSNLIYFAMGISFMFLLLYIFYHIITDSTRYGGSMGYIYYPLLISHIILAAIQAPLVLFAFLYGYSGQIEKHKRLVKISYPVWLYVSISGVICYLMISPYYKILS